MPQVKFNQIQSEEMPDGFVKQYLNKNIQHKRAEDAYRIKLEGVTVTNVKVTDYRMTAEKK